MRTPDDIWLFSTDADAAAALDWCRKNHIPVPAGRAIVSFENNPDYFHHGITSIMLDNETIGYNLAHALIGDIPVETTRRGYVRMHAVVVERVTT